MKVRWTPESIRFRITPGELEQLRAGQGVTSVLRIPGGSWQATITPAIPDAPTTLGGAEPGNITLSLSAADLARLSDPVNEGVYFRTPDDEPPVRYFIEKDFPCVHPRPKEAQEETETFAPPHGFAERHRTGCV